MNGRGLEWHTSSTHAGCSCQDCDPDHVLGTGAMVQSKPSVTISPVHGQASAGPVHRFEESPIHRRFDPSSTTEIAAGLRCFVAERFGLADPDYSEAPAAVPDGWETYTYRFALAAD